MSKLWVEKYRPNTIDNVIEFFKEKDIIGEITIVIKGINKKRDLELSKSNLKQELNELVNAGLSLSAASKYLAKKNGIKKSIIYNMNYDLSK